MSYIGNQPVSIAFITDQFSGDGSTTVFTMSVAPANSASILVAVSGVVQDPSTYAVSGTDLTFTGAPPTGTGNISVRYLGVPASNVATTAYRTITEFTATAGQTTFTPASYTVGFINVYRNGVLLGTADYTATNGTTVVLAVGATSGDLITTEGFYVSGMISGIPAVGSSVIGAYIADDAITTTKIADSNVTTAKIDDDAVTTAKILDANVTPAKLSQPLTSGTAQASTSGTSIDFTGIPSWVKRITVMFSGVSTNGSSSISIQLGTSGGIVSSGYLGSGCFVQPSNTTSSSTATAQFLASMNVASSTVFHGTSTLNLLNSATNLWSFQSVGARSDNAANIFGAGSVTLSGVLDRIRITTANGTDTFDAGSINILYE